jgi:hypothetical protein
VDDGDDPRDHRADAYTGKPRREPRVEPFPSPARSSAGAYPGRQAGALVNRSQPGAHLVVAEQDARAASAGDNEHVDMLLFDAEANTRYEVELKLGQRMSLTSFGRSRIGTLSVDATRSMNMLV